MDIDNNISDYFNGSIDYYIIIDEDLKNRTQLPNDTGPAVQSFSFWSDEAIVRIILYSIIFLFAIVGNTLVIVTLSQNKRLRTVTNVFLLNLAVSDLLLGVFCMPFTLVGALLRNFIFGEVMCKLIPYLQASSVSVSVWTLVSISLERYFAICKPLHSRLWQTTSHALKVIVGIWSCSLLIMGPIAYLSTLMPTKGERYKCREFWPSIEAERIFNILLDAILLLIPLIIMILAYGAISYTLWEGVKVEAAASKNELPLNAFNPKDLQNNGLNTKRSTTTPLIVKANAEQSRKAKKKVVRMLFILVVEFFICWTPLYLAHTWSLFDPMAVYNALGSTGFSIIHLVAYVSSCCNPITYCFMHKKFRNGFLDAISCRRRRRWRSMRQQSETAVNSTVLSTRVLSSRKDAIELSERFGD